MIEIGERFDRLVFVGEAFRDATRNWRGRFRCDCGTEVVWRISTVRGNAKRGWCSCPECYFAATGKMPNVARGKIILATDPGNDV